MTKEEFLKNYSNKHILVETVEDLDYITKTYATNYNIWLNNLQKPNFSINNKYNRKGIIILFDLDLYAYHGYYDKEVIEYIHVNEILNRNKKIEKNKMNKIREILEKLYKNPELRRSIIPLFISHPGIGKSSEITAFAKDKGIEVVEMIASQMSPFEVSGIAIK